jgi:hypothetical protein
MPFLQYGSISQTLKADFRRLLRSLRSLLLLSQMKKQQGEIAPTLLCRRQLARFSNFAGIDGASVSCRDFHSSNAAMPSSLAK